MSKCAWPFMEASARWRWTWRLGWGHKDDADMLDVSLGNALCQIGNWLALFEDRHARNEWRAPIDRDLAHSIDADFVGIFERHNPSARDDVTTPAARQPAKV